jgi:hypothetical protein
MKYGVICVNRGMWGGMQSWLKENGEIKLFDTEKEAQREAERINKSRGRINNFTQYFAEKFE